MTVHIYYCPLDKHYITYRSGPISYIFDNDNKFLFVFSFDVRGKPLSQARHWSAPETFGSRAKFNTASEPATLDLEVRYV